MGISMRLNSFFESWNHCPKSRLIRIRFFSSRTTTSHMLTAARKHSFAEFESSRETSEVSLWASVSLQIQMCVSRSNLILNSRFCLGPDPALLPNPTHRLWAQRCLQGFLDSL